MNSNQRLALLLVVNLFASVNEVFLAGFSAHVACGDAIRTLLNEADLPGDRVVVHFSQKDTPPTYRELLEYCNTYRDNSENFEEEI